MFCKSNVLTDKKGEYFFVKIEKIWNETELAADETTFDLFNWLIFSICDVLRGVTEAIFKIENLKTIILVEKIEMSISIISILFAVIEKLLTKSSLKKVFI